MTIQLLNVVDKISQLEIAGVRVRDVDEIRAAVTERDCPILIPEPLNFLSNITIVRDSYGPAATAMKTITYQLGYTFLYAPVGAGRELERYWDMVKKAALILDAFIADDDMTSGTSFDEAVDITPVSVVEFGPVPDPAGNQFIGCRFQFQVIEFIN